MRCSSTGIPATASQLPSDAMPACTARQPPPPPPPAARSVTGIFGGEPKPPAGGNPDSNTLISDMTTVICLDDYHSLDRNVRRGPCCWGGGRHIWQLGGICSCAALRCAWQGCRAAVKLPRSMRAVTAGRLHLPGRPPPVAPRSPSCA